MAAPLRIALNTLYVGAGVAGGRTYRDGLLRGLAALEGQEDYVVYTRRQPNLPKLPERFRLQEAPIPPTSQIWRTIWEYGVLPQQIRRGSYSVYHALGNLTPRIRGVPVVLTVHDLIHRHFPRSVPTAHRLFMRLVLPSAAQRADRVIVDSHFVKLQLIEELGVREERIRVIPLGVEHPPEEFHSDPLQEVRNRYQIREPYLLAVGRGYPHKNIVGLLRAFAVLEPSIRPQLVLVGDQYRAGDDVDRTLAMLRLTNQVVRTGYVPGHDLAGLYSGALAFVFPSLAEGFGLPVLEAMIRGVPVVASNLTAIPEVVGPAGLLADPRNPDEFAAALRQILLDSQLRNTLRDRGRSWAKQFTWERCAAQTLAVYREFA